MLLVDGSWSIGRMNFKTIRNFIARMVSVFDIGPDRVQIGNVLIRPDECGRGWRTVVIIFYESIDLTSIKDEKNKSIKY